MRILLIIKLCILFLFLGENFITMFPFFKKITVLKSELKPSLYDYNVKSLNGTDVPMSTYRNKVLIIFNSASKCGLTKNHINQFNELHEKFNDKGLEILGFPTYQFFSQEFKQSCDISQFNQEKNIKYNVFAPVEVNGENTHELFKYLKFNCDEMHDENGVLDNIGWNFGKFLVDKNGNVVKYFSPKLSPLNMEKDITDLL
ncbi:glutathione peroxidase-like thioredoxin peroxidase, putative [Plasmodium vinckei]|uniref:Glutathione peroxidase n=1 Tax=Plasmodium vinckei TaxID=5860 RepID=A0A6V7SNF1_PLAVN|nr:glutathione peroxidase-like thioredoxin peroxidase, putative [Plasmodium vinckei]